MTGRTWQVSPGAAADLVLAFSPDGRRFASTGTDGGVWLWETTTWDRVRRFDTTGAWAWSLVFDPAGGHLAAGADDGTVGVWDLATLLGKHLGDLGGPVRAVAFDPDGARFAAAGEAGTVRVWTVAGWAPCAEFTVPAPVRALAFDTDLLAVGGPAVQLWSTVDWTLVRTVESDIDEVRELSLDDDGLTVQGRRMAAREILISYDRTDWSQTGRDEHPVDFEADPGVVSALSPDDSVHVYSDNGTVTIDTGDDEIVRRYVDLTVYAIALDSSGTRLAACAPLTGARPGLWVRDDAGWRRIAAEAVASPTWHGRLLAGCVGNRVVVWDTGSGAEIRRLSGAGTVWAAAFSPDGATLAAFGGKGLVRWDTATWEPTRLGGKHLYFPIVSYTDTGELLAAGGTGGSVDVIGAGEPVRIIRWTDHTGLGLAISPDGGLIAIGSDGPVTLWDLRADELRHTLDGPRNTAAVAFSPDGRRLATGGADRTIRIWDVASGRLTDTVHGHRNLILALAFGPGSTLVSSGGDGIRRWDLRSGECVGHLIDGIPDAGWWA